MLSAKDLASYGFLGFIGLTIVEGLLVVQPPTVVSSCTEELVVVSPLVGVRPRSPPEDLAGNKTT
jgi:hypothetical protein